jgi:D-sedoheptulose 7-phosphate isomerase
MLDQRIQQQFFESADLQYQAAEGLAAPLAEAAGALLAALTNGGKLMIAGTLAVHAAALLAGRFERDRPPLAAMALRGGLAGDAPRQLRALGLPGDVLLLLDDGEADPAAAIAAAQAKDMTLVVLAGRNNAALAELLAETDVFIAMPADRVPRVAELQLLAVHALCDAIDFQLMGEQDT